MELMDRITINPNVMAGKPVIRGTRIAVQLIVELLTKGVTEEEILTDYYPDLAKEDKAAILYTAKSCSYK
jgi:uncharacterized protein (DUF433 family)